MKAIENKLTDQNLIDETGKTIKATYGDFIRIIIGTMNGTMDTAEMRKRFRILDVLDEAKKGKKLKAELQFEDADFDYLKKFIPHQWQFMSRDLIDFEDHILNIK